MSRNGSGVYSLPAGNPVATGTAISTTWANNTLNDIASALTGSLSSDGQTSLSGNLNFNTNKPINLADPTLAQDAVTLNYLTTQPVAFGGNITVPTQTTGDNSTKASSTAFVQTAISVAIQKIYPVGCIYTATTSTNPNTTLGFGTWVAFGAGRVLVGDGGGFTAGATGGSADAVIVSHTHSAIVTDSGHNHTVFHGAGVQGSTGTEMQNSAGTSGYTVTGNSTTGISVSNSTTGVSGTNANLQPYVVVYMWTRTA